MSHCEGHGCVLCCLVPVSKSLVVLPEKKKKVNLVENVGISAVSCGRFGS